jgi:uncharacterized protein (TIGR03435 family)
MRGVIFISFLASAGACAFGQSGQGPGTFDAAVIKPFAEGTPMRMSGCMGGPGAGDPGRVTCEHVTLKMLLMQAYQAKAQEIVGPNWLDGAYFNIDATVPRGATRQDIPIMYRNLLAERFKVVTHREPRLLPGYAITVGKGGIKAAVASEAADAPGAADAPVGKLSVGTDGFTVLPRSMLAAGPIILFSHGRARLQASGATVAQLAEALTRQLGRVVVDETGLGGKYEMKLYWVPGEGEPGAGPMQAPGAAAEGRTPDPTAPDADITFAMDQQLGLKLTPKRVSREVIVLDQAERIPTEN